MMRLAIFGGTFDPIHNGHLRLAREAADHFSLDKILFITAGTPPHKRGATTTPYEHRHRMVEVACQTDPRFEPSRLEDHPGKSYSIDTIRRVKEKLGPGDQLFFLIGADAFAEIGTWRKSEDVLREVDFTVVSRPGYNYPIPAGARVHRLETLAIPVSSSDIRRELELGDIPMDIPASVAEYVRENALYR
jgi:nicotinate-nucleotide adenylyltransferase